MYACFIAYAVAFALSRGYSESMASYAVMTYMLAAFIGQFILGGICDRNQINKYVFILGITISATLQTAIFLFNSLPLFFLLYTLTGFVTQPLGSILDTWMLKTIDYDMIHFGRARSMGTLGYAIVMLAFGQLIKYYGYQAAMIGTILCTILTVLLSFIVPNAGAERSGGAARSGDAPHPDSTVRSGSMVRSSGTSHPGSTARSSGTSHPGSTARSDGTSHPGSTARSDGTSHPGSTARSDVISRPDKGKSYGSMGELLRNPQYRALLVVLFLLGLAVAPFNNLKIMLLQAVGGDVGDQGIDSFIGCVAQFLMFCFPQIVSMFSEYGKLVVSASLACIGSIIFLAAKVPLVVFAGTFLTLGLYGIANSSSRFIVGKYLDSSLHTKAIGMGDACYNNISAMFAMLYAGRLSEAFGARAVIPISILLSAGALVYLRFSALRDRFFRAG